MPDKHLHIISFDVPDPPNYGGVIDIYYKIGSLHKVGVKVHLHCFTSTRERSPQLEEICFSVNYYKRKTGLFSALWWKPYIVFSRRSSVLLANLIKDNHPILFEGLHSCHLIGHRKLRDRFKIYRESNIEHHYYYHLFKAEDNLFKKLYFVLSSLKLRAFQPTLRHADIMLTVSKQDNDYLQSRFKNIPVQYLPSFHGEEEVNSLPGKGKYCLYQGNLSVAENIKAVEFLILEVFPGIKHPLIVAGLNPPDNLVKLCQEHSNVTIITNPGHEEMVRLIQEAHINILVTFQATGLKPKLLHALFNGRFCLVNPEMITGTELASVCELGTSPKRFRRQIGALMQKEFTEEDIVKRKETLLKWHSNKENCNTLLNLLPL